MQDAQVLRIEGGGRVVALLAPAEPAVEGAHRGGAVMQGVQGDNPAGP